MIKEIVLTDGQEMCVNQINRFLKSSERVYILKGRAGTGKTTVIKYALSDYITEDILNFNPFEKRLYNVLGITLAHKAKDNLSSSIPYVNTFASVFGHREITTEDGDRIFQPDPAALEKADCNQRWKVVVVDECSQFSEKMVRILFTLLNSNTKIIFMGDPGQLPPILEDNQTDNNRDSMTFDFILPKWCKMELTERVRQTVGNPIIDLSDIIYAEIFGGNDFYKILKALKNDSLDVDGKGHQAILAEQLYEKFVEVAHDDYMETKLVAYRRATVADYNKYLRNYIHYNPVAKYTPGEIIYLNKSFYCENDEEKWVVQNSSEHVITDIHQSEFDGIPVDMIGIGEGRYLPQVEGDYYSRAHTMYKQRIKKFENLKNYEGKWNFINSFASISYGYTLTTHKAQGSTYKNIFVDVNDIAAVRKITHKRKLQSLYTALTRASDNAYFLKTKD